MVEVLKKGYDKKYEATCPSCRSELLYKEEDIMVKEVTNNGNKTTKDIIICPCCNHDIIIGGFNYYG